MAKRLVVIGAGPMGLFAAYLAAKRGLQVTVLERDRIGASLLTWGSTRFFSPLEMNVPAGLREDLPGLPPDDALLTGAEFVDRVLIPLARSPLLYDRVLVRRRVASVTRAGMTREDFPNHPLRHERPFLLLVEGQGGESVLEADLVFDATGAFQPTGFGPGGLPIAGEALRRLNEVEALARDPARGRVLLLGHGHSAAHALLALEAARAPETKVTWAFRSRNRMPLRETPDDPLPERARVVAAANRLAAAPPPWLEVRRADSLLRLEKAGAAWRAHFSADGAVREIDAVAAFTGHRPDLSFLSELALDLSPVTEGVRPLQAALSGATDCLSVPRVAARDLASGEPGFHLIGAKSYGRTNTFLLRDGLRHVEMMLENA